MSNLEKFYFENGVPREDQILLSKNIVITVPDCDFDLTPVLLRLRLSPYEVAVTWPKKDVNMLAEICAVSPLFVLQVGRKFFKKFSYINGDGDCEDRELRKKLKGALADMYVGLHHHDEFSIRDGLGTVHDLIDLLKSQRRSFCCVTNHGSVGGWIKQYNACRKAGIKPLFGMEAYVNNYRGDDPEMKKKHRSNNHLLLTAKTEAGFYNIIRIHNDAQQNGFYYSPRANWGAFEQWGDGICGTSACLAGEIPRALMDDDWDKAEEIYKFYNEAFDDFYIELQIIEFEMQRESNRRLIQLAERIDAPVVLACDSHYLEPEHSETHDLLLMMRQGKTVLDKREKEEDVWNFDVRNLYYRNSKQMEDVFYNGYTDIDGNEQPPFKDDVFTEKVFRRGMFNTRKIALAAEDISLDDSIKLPRLYDDSEKILRDKTNKGFKKRGLHLKENKSEYLSRLKHEYKTICKLGWADYFLVMEKIISDADRDFSDRVGEWSIGYGRGSAAGSLLSYCIGLTDVDPIEHGLLFERFLDEGRSDPPDIDTDFHPDIRDDVKKNIIDSFGATNTCSIGTYSTYKTRAVVLDVARTLGLDVYEANAVTKKLDPLRSFNEEESGDGEIVDDMSFDDICYHYPDLKDYFEKYPEVRFHSEVIRNQIKNMGKHAGGVIISDLDLRDRIPVLMDKNGDTLSAWCESGNVAELSAVGLVKFDILGLKNLPIISDCIRLIEETTGDKIKREDIPTDDYRAIKQGSHRDMVGIFQFENPATMEIVREVGMESLNDVSAITSLIRPGPKDMGMDMIYANRKKGEPYEMPEFLREQLKETYGVVTYQEQCMRVSQVLAGFTPSESNKLRKAIGKKIPTLMAEMKEKFIKGAKERVDKGEITQQEVEDIWDILESFAGYGFNKSHALAYSVITTIELWLKYHYPTQYLTSLLCNTKQGAKKGYAKNLLTYYINYCRKNHIEVLPPDINNSKQGFTIQDHKIVYSFGHIKNVGTSASAIVAAQPYESMEDFFERAQVERKVKDKVRYQKLNKKVVLALCTAGAFDCWGTRNEMMNEYFKLRNKKNEEAPEYDEDKWMALEEEACGICLSIPSLRMDYAEMIEEKKWQTIERRGDVTRPMVFGRITNIRPQTSKRSGNQMYNCEVSDGMDTLNFYVFTAAMDSWRHNVKSGYIVAIPMKSFEDSDTYFYDDRREVIVVKK